MSQPYDPALPEYIVSADQMALDWPMKLTPEAAENILGLAKRYGNKALPPELLSVAVATVSAERAK